MSTNKRNAVLRVIAASLAVCLLAAPAGAQEVGPEMIGTIPGTGMLRDEFRARALAQLTALALNALTYKLVHEEYAANFGELTGSESWNLELMNMFTGEPLRGIYFEPSPNQMTDDPVVGMTFNMDLPEVPIMPPAGAGGDAAGGGAAEGGAGGAAAGGAGGGFGFDPSLVQGAIAAAGIPNPLRVNPEAIRNFSGGDVYYYTKNNLLQLVLFAPDGTYLEYVDEAPNFNHLNRMTVRLPGAKFPEDWLAAQVLYFTEVLLPQYYNMVQFMGGRETVPTASFATLGAQERLQLATELDIIVVNPYSRQAAKAGSAFAAGDFIETDPLHALPLHLGLPSGQVISHAELVLLGPGEETAARQAVEKRNQPPKRQGAPPLGGRKPRR